MAIKYKDTKIKEFQIPKGSSKEGTPYNADNFPLPSAANAYNPSTHTLCYKIGDVGPGGGIIFGIPGSPSMIPANEYWEISHDLSSIDEPDWRLGLDLGIFYPALHPKTKGCSYHPGGSEWGLLGVTGLNSGTNMWWGQGQNNTNTMYTADTNLYSSDLSINPGGDSACAPYTPCSPNNNSRNVAFRLAKDYQGGNKTDWFLPSFAEFLVAKWTVGVMQGTSNPQYNAAQFDLVGLDGISPVHYWTSSATDGANIQNFNLSFPQGPETAAISMRSDTTNWDFDSSYRCFTRRVRAVRKFTCVKPVVIGPIDDFVLTNGGVSCPDMTPECVDYNYRDGTCGSVPGSLCGWSGVHPGNGTPILDTTTVYSGGGGPGAQPAGVLQSPLEGDSVMGSHHAFLYLNKKDVKGQTITKNDWLDESEGYTITMWDADFMFLGKWHYANLFRINNIPVVSESSGPMVMEPRITVKLINATHLLGDYPVIDYSRHINGSYGSSSGAYIKIECAHTANPASNYVFENAINETWLGNPSSTTYSNFAMYEFPSICIDWNPSAPTGITMCYPWHATYQPANCCNVYVTQNDCKATGSIPGNPLACEMGVSSSKLHSSTRIDDGYYPTALIEDSSVHLPKNSKDYKAELAKKRRSDKKKAYNKKHKKKD